MNRAEYERLKRKADEDYRQNLAAIERVWNISQRLGEGESSPTRGAIVASKSNEEQVSEPFGGNGRIGKGSLREAIRITIAALAESFTLPQIERTLKTKHPNWEIKRASVHTTLIRLVEEGEIEVVTQGSGRRPSEYRRK